MASESFLLHRATHPVAVGSLFEQYGQHQPLNRQSERYAREGVELSPSTLADQVGGCAMLLRPLCDLICAHVACR
jgi:transposase